MTFYLAMVLAGIILLAGVLASKVAAYGMGRAMVWMVNHIRLAVPSLYPIMTLALLLITFGLADGLGGNGFLAVYVAGIVLGNLPLTERDLILSFHDGLS